MTAHLRNMEAYPRLVNVNHQGSDNQPRLGYYTQYMRAVLEQTTQFYHDNCQVSVQSNHDIIPLAGRQDVGHWEPIKNVLYYG